MTNDWFDLYKLILKPISFHFYYRPIVKKNSFFFFPARRQLCILRFSILLFRCRFSRKIMWLKFVNTNNKPEVIVEYFMSYVEKMRSKCVSFYQVNVNTLQINQNLYFPSFAFENTFTGTARIIRSDQGISRNYCDLIRVIHSHVIRVLFVEVRTQTRYRFVHKKLRFVSTLNHLLKDPHSTPTVIVRYILRD